MQNRRMTVITDSGNLVSEDQVINNDHCVPEKKNDFLELKSPGMLIVTAHGPTGPRRLL